MQLIDIGVNLTNTRLRVNVEQILQQSIKVGVTQLVISCTSIEHGQVAIGLCRQYPGQLFCTSGVHPHDAKDWSEDTKARLQVLIKEDCVRAIGETGLDFNRDFSPRDQQTDVFQQQLDIAAGSDLPIFLHQRDAFDTFHCLLREYRSQLNDAVVHCFTDDKKALYALLDLDCHIGITGWICDERRGRELQTLVRDIPANRLMLETDAPYLLPRDLPEKPDNNVNLPQYLPHICRAVARHQGKQPEALAEEVIKTTRLFFGI